MKTCLPFSFGQPVLTAEAMREADRLTIETFGLPGLTLMESAGRKAVEAMEVTFGSMRNKRVICFCGTGNNGGDGFVVARVLHAQGAQVTVVVVGDLTRIRDDAATNWKLLQQLAANDTENRLQLTPFEHLDDLDALEPADLLVDALLGTGQKDTPRHPFPDLIHWFNARSAHRVSLDLPTGLQSDLGHTLGTAAVQADLTVTMGALKAGLLLGEGPDVAGQTVVAEIGIPRFILDQVDTMPGCAMMPTDEAISTWLPKRPRNVHKYTAGTVLVVGGSPGMTGAPVMASQAAARVGAGYVTCACPESVQPVLATTMTEITTLGLTTSPLEGIETEKALHTLGPRLEKAHALLVGPGLGRHPQTQTFIQTLLRQTTLPVVVDADALTALADLSEEIPTLSQGRWILTPHAGEFGRLAAGADLSDRIRTVQSWAKRWDCVLLLKGMPSVVGTPNGTVFIVAPGHPALATAGTGDILAGMCVGLLAQGLSPETAAICALALGSAAAERYALQHYPSTLVATDLLDQVPKVWLERFM